MIGRIAVKKDERLFARKRRAIPRGDTRIIAERDINRPHTIINIGGNIGRIWLRKENHFALYQIKRGNKADIDQDESNKNFLYPICKRHQKPL